jgi:methylated-DNA-protein-cysteine methyltransferase-like protein
MREFTRTVIQLIQSIPFGTVASYGSIAAAAGSPGATRQVVRILHSCTESYDLPWHRVVSKDGRILLAHGGQFEEQAALLRAEGIAVSPEGTVDRNHFWSLVLRT